MSKKFTGNIGLMLVMLLISGFILLPELYFGGGSGLQGNDAFFHLTRFTDAAMQIKTGHFSYFQQFQTLNHSGKIVNALYGPLVAYLMGALIVLVHFHGLIFWSLYLFVVNFVGLACMVYLQRQLGAKWVVALMVGTLFISTGAVTATIASGGMYALGYAVLPIIISSAIRLLHDEKKPVKVWELTLGLTLLAQIHMLALLLGMIIYALALLTYVIFSRRGFRIVLLGNLKAAGLVLLLNFNIYGGYFEVVHSNADLAMPFRFTVMNWPAKVSFTQLNFGNLSGFLALLLVGIFGMALWKFFKLLWLKFALSVSLIFAFLAFSNVTLLSAQTIFQFSARFLAVSLVMALALLGFVLTNFPSKLLVLLTGLVLGLTVGIYMANSAVSARAFRQGAKNPVNQGAFTSTAARYAALTNLSNLTELSNLTKTPSELTDYLINNAPDKLKQQNLTDEPALLLPYFYDNVLAMKNFQGQNLRQVISNQGLQLTWMAPSQGQTTLPVIVYAHSQVKLNNKLLSDSELSRSAVGALQIKAPVGQNHVTISYQPYLWFRIGAALQLLGILGLLIFQIIKKVSSPA